MATVEILCRFDAGKQAPVVFLRDTIQGDKIQVWDGQGQPKMMPVDYYRMTAPLSAEDERVLAERFKQATGRQDQIVHINHRMPRTPRPVPNVLAPNTPAPAKTEMKDINPPPAPAARKGNAKPLDAQPLPAGPAGDLPKAGEIPAPAQPAAQATAPAPVNPNEPPSAGMFRRLQELQARMNELSAAITAKQQEIQNATTDYETAKKACQELTEELKRTLEAEAAEELRKRQEMLAQLTGNVDPLAQAVQALHDTATKAPETAQEAQTPPQQAQAPAKNGNGSKAATKPPAKPAGKTAAKAHPAPAKKK